MDDMAEKRDCPNEVLEQEAKTLAAVNSRDIWKTLCVIAITMALSMGSYIWGHAGSIDYSEAKKIVSSPENPYVSDKALIDDTLRQLAGKLDQMDTINRKLDDICNGLAAVEKNPRPCE